MSSPSPESRLIRLIYIVGRYPEVSTTFIDGEINALQQIGDFDIKVISLRYPLTPVEISPEHQAIRKSTTYLIPRKWSEFNYLGFIGSNLYYMFSTPNAYWGTLYHLLTRPHPDLSSRLKTIMHFSLGVYAAGLLRNKEYDHLHAHFIDRSTLLAMVISRLHRKTYSLTAHAADIYTNQVLIHEKLSNAKFVITVSQYNKQHFLQSFPDIDPQKIHVLHPWVNLSSFVPGNHRSEQDGLHILSVGRLVEKKGHLDLVNACCILHQHGVDFECRIIGEGELRRKLEELINRHKLEEQVSLMGAQPLNRVRELLEDWCDVFALPCVISKDGDRDGIPVSLAEAMAMEVPVISTNIAGIGELVQPGVGIIVPPGDPEALAAALEQLKKSNAEALTEMGKRGRQIVNNEFSLHREVGKLAEMFRKAAAR